MPIPGALARRLGIIPVPHPVVAMPEPATCPHGHRWEAPADDLAGAHAGAQELARFRVEAEAVARLQHPNVVQIYEVGEQGGLPFFSLEFVPGGTLKDRLDGTAWADRRAARLVATLADAMHYAH